MITRLGLPATVQERLSGWVRIQERRASTPAGARPGPVITLSRRFGCEGFTLGMRLQTLLNGPGDGPWSVFDQALLEKVAEDEGISMRLLNDLGAPDRALEAFGFHPSGAVTQDEAFAKVAKALVQVARRGHAIIIGRGGAVLCRDLPNAFHFRLEASLDWRIASIMRRLELTEREAEKFVRTQSVQRDRFMKDCLGTDLATWPHFDAIFNNERHGPDEMAAAILAYVRAGWPEEAPAGNAKADLPLVGKR